MGFIKKLPHDLVASFRSTLDEALEASLLLQTVDAADPVFRAQMQVTREVLNEIGAGDIRVSYCQFAGDGRMIERERDPRGHRLLRRRVDFEVGPSSHASVPPFFRTPDPLGGAPDNSTASACRWGAATPFGVPRFTVVGSSDCGPR
jgi:hypothetical protein